MIAGVDESNIDQLLDVMPVDVNAAVSFARNAFVSLTTTYRYTCTYCTYYGPPGQAELVSPEVFTLVGTGRVLHRRL